MVDYNDLKVTKVGTYFRCKRCAIYLKLETVQYTQIVFS